MKLRRWSGKTQWAGRGWQEMRRSLYGGVCQAAKALLPIEFDTQAEYSP